MALKIRRGLEVDRTAFTPEEGELIYTTDDKIVYVGDGATAGGTKVTGSLPSRTTATATTASTADGSSANINITGYKGYVLYSIQTSHAAWVRIYATSAARTADASRVEGVDPAADGGVIAEVITTSSQTVLMTPAVLGFSAESTPSTNIAVSVKNKSGSAAAITVTLSLLALEA